MGGLFSKPKMPEVKPAPPPPDRNSTEVAEAAEAQRKRYSGAGAFQSLLTSGSGASTASSAAVRMLGGTVRA